MESESSIYNSLVNIKSFTIHKFSFFSLFYILFTDNFLILLMCKITRYLKDLQINNKLELF